MLGILTIVFVVLKCLGIIAWSWWLVFLPAIISLVIAILGLIFFIILGAKAQKTKLNFK